MSLPLGRCSFCAAVGVVLSVVVSCPPGALAQSLETVSGDTSSSTRVVNLRVERINLEQLERFLREGTVVLVDVRTYGAYLAAHLPDAVSIPLDKLEGALPRLRALNARIVFYCGGEAGVRSGRAAAMLLEHGFQHVYCLDGGFDRWVASGRVVIVQPTET